MTSNKRLSRLGRWLIIAALLGMVLLMVTSLIQAVVIIKYGQHNYARPADVIIVLGGGPEGTVRRAQHGAALYAQGYADYVICSGAKDPQKGRTEAERCASSLRKHGVPESAIILETQSQSTEENAINVARIMHQRGWHSAVLVSDDFHLWRARWMFDIEGVQVWTSPAQLTNHSLTFRAKMFPIVREVLATDYFVIKSVLGLRQTHTPF